MFYVEVDDVETALENAGRLGGKQVLSPGANANEEVVIGYFIDIDGNLVGVAGTK